MNTEKGVGQHMRNYYEHFGMDPLNTQSPRQGLEESEHELNLFKIKDMRFEG